MQAPRTIKDIRRRFYAALYPRERWSPSEWAEKCRVLSPDESSEPGPYNFDRTPYMRGIMDATATAGVQEVVCLKGAQVGWSEACRNLLGYWVDLAPGPILALMPDQLSADAFKIERVDPLIKNTLAVSAHLTGRAWDDTKYRVRFDTCWLFLAWAGGKSQTKTRPVRRLICEEPDEFPPFTSTGGDPLSKAEKRLTTYADKGRAMALIGGTPTTRMGNAWKRWEMCGARFHFYVPCPHCNGYQQLFWKQVKWPDLKEEGDRSRRANLIQSGNLAYYECEHANCKGQILDHHKPRMLRRGVWAAEDQAVTADGRVVGPEVKARRVGFKLSGLYSPWVTFSQLASEWVLAQDDVHSLCDFINQRLAEPFEEQRAKPEPSEIEKRAVGAPPPMVVPNWAKLVIATADTQGTSEQDGYFWYVIRAWGYEYRSQLIDFGVCSSKQELVDRCLHRQIPRESGGSVAPYILLVDSGGPRWGEVYQLAQSDQRIKPTKGENQRRDFMVVERPQKAHNVVLWKIDTEQSKDLLYQFIWRDPDRTKWMPHNAINADYCRQMTSEAKVFDPVQGREAWVEIVKNSNHLWDCEQQQVAAAWRIGCGLVKPKQREQNDTEPAITTSDWMSRGRKY